MPDQHADLELDLAGATLETAEAQISVLVLLFNALTRLELAERNLALMRAARSTASATNILAVLTRQAVMHSVAVDKPSVAASTDQRVMHL